MAGNVVEATSRHLRQPAPLHFPAEEKVPETRRHFEVRTALFLILRAALGDRAVVGSDQFVYWDPTDPRRCAAPDVFVRRGVPDFPLEIWKVWEHGAPELAVEVISTSDIGEVAWETKLERYRAMGVRELVRFDVEQGSFRIWDGLDGDLVERNPDHPTFSRSEVLEAYLVVGEAPTFGRVLRVADDADGKRPWPTAEESRAAAEAARLAAEDRIAELEAELGRR